MLSKSILTHFCDSIKYIVFTVPWWSYLSHITFRGIFYNGHHWSKCYIFIVPSLAWTHFDSLSTTNRGQNSVICLSKSLHSVHSNVKMCKHLFLLSKRFTSMQWLIHLLLRPQYYFSTKDIYNDLQVLQNGINENVNSYKIKLYLYEVHIS